jgi:hypothetical protein
MAFFFGLAAVVYIVATVVLLRVAQRRLERIER